ncbi:protein RDM1-like [Lotus japonicus]|uniref:protein RDM1-like n=1 Tax=Lotus japonicus TaxID=34305 RepID=UPI002586C860|nr:protein RDM1-like [Lotus japonicus]
MLRRHAPEIHSLLSDSETESDDNYEVRRTGDVNGPRNRSGGEGGDDRSKRNTKGKTKVLSDTKADEDQENLEELAKKYQKQIKIMPIPAGRIENGIFFTWEELAKSLRILYGQPIHYLTYKLIKQWDEAMIGNGDEKKALVAMFGFSKAESTIWGVENIHRLTTSPTQLAKLWLEDPNYHAAVAEVLPPP